ARRRGVGPGARARGEELGRGAVVRELAPPGPRRAPHAVALVTLGANRLAAPLSTLACDQPGGPARVDRPAAARWTLAPLECALDGLHTPSAARDRARGWRPAARRRAGGDPRFGDTTPAPAAAEAARTGEEPRRGKPLPPRRQRGHHPDGRAPRPPEWWAWPSRARACRGAPGSARATRGRAPRAPRSRSAGAAGAWGRRSAWATP